MISVWPRRVMARIPADAAALVFLTTVFAIFLGRSWLAWGHLDADYGREMFVPQRLAEGDVLYRDVRYPYGPLVPLLHSLLYRAFSPHLNVLYGSGIAGTAAVVLALYAVARQLTSTSVATIAALLAMVDLMFIPGFSFSFSYVFPYSFPALWGLAFTLVALAATLRLLVVGGVPLAALAGAAIGCAVLSKHEFAVLSLGIGGTALVGLAMLRTPRFWRSAGPLIALAVGLPLLGYGLLARASSLDTIVSRNLFSSDYFGLPITWRIAGLKPGWSTLEIAQTLGLRFWSSARWYVVPLACVVAAGFAAAPAPVATDGPRPRSMRRLLAMLALLVGASLMLAATLPTSPRGAELPLPVRLRYGALPALVASWLVLETFRIVRLRLRDGRSDPQSLQRCLTAAVSLVMLMRVVNALEPLQYANFYLGPAIVLGCIALADVLPTKLAAMGACRRWARFAALAVLVLLTAKIASVRWAAWADRTEPLVTPRGTMMLPAWDPTVDTYRDALEIVLKTTPRDASLLAIPAETSLYFLSGRGNRLFETSLIAAVTTESAEREYVAALQQDPPDLVLTSDRTQAEYGRGVFGVDNGRIVQQWIEAHYERGAAVGTKPGLRIQTWLPRFPAERASSPIRAERDLAYERGSEASLTLDLYVPTRFAGPRPVLLFFHGGGWQTGSKADAIPSGERAAAGRRRWPSMAPYLSSGVAVATASYRLAGEARAPAAVEDARSALYWLAAHASELGIDRKRIVVIGPSAGGHLALMVALTYASPAFGPLPEAAARPTVVGAIDLYGISDLTELVEDASRPWVGEWLPEGPERDAVAARMSPVHQVHPNAPPVLIVHSRADAVVPFRQAKILHDALQTAGVQVEMLTFPSAIHGFFTARENDLLEKRILQFLDRLGLVETPADAAGTNRSPASRQLQPAPGTG